jgi:hypothetical protein
LKAPSQIISSSTCAHTTEAERSQTFSGRLRFWEETSILRLWLVLRSVGGLVQDWCIGWPPGLGHADCRPLLIANVIRATVGVRLCETSRILYACQKAEGCSRCLNIPNVTYSRSCSIEVVVDSRRVPQYPFLLYFQIAKAAPSTELLDARCAV